MKFPGWGGGGVRKLSQCTSALWELYTHQIPDDAGLENTEHEQAPREKAQGRFAEGLPEHHPILHSLRDADDAHVVEQENVNDCALNSFTLESQTRPTKGVHVATYIADFIGGFRASARKPHHAGVLEATNTLHQCR